MEDPFVNKQDQISMALVAHEVGFEAIEKIVDYYNRMLLTCIITIAKDTGKSPTEIRNSLEVDLGLEGAMDIYLNTLSAATQYNKDIFDIEEE